MQNLSTVKVDQLSDDQILNFWSQAKANKIGLDQLEVEAMRKNMPKAEFQKLKSRISLLDPVSESTSFEKSDARKVVGTEATEKESEEDIQKKTKTSKIFGSELFSNKKLTFEPNLKMATPQNYELGPDDELLVDIYGYSEETFNLKVSPEGTIRIPMAGIINVGGLTIEQASKRIRQMLSKIYDRINTGETQVNINLGNIRSIKVILVGEVQMPGTYTLPSLATAFNALYASGGPSENGSMRNIKIIRNNRVVTTIDVYDFIMNGISKGNIRLQDQDIIKVSPYETRVELKGQVKREGFYEVKKNENLKSVFEYSGGFSDYAYKARVKVIRNDSKQKSVADIPEELYSMFEPKSGDLYLIDSILDRFENRVRISGAVFRPGIYAREEGLTVSSLIKKADGVKEDAFMTRGLIYRLKEDNSQEVISFNISEILSSPSKDIVLKREDHIQIGSIKDLQERYNLVINGDVLYPGVYDYADNMKIEDLILAAGGFKESASIKRIEVSRRKDDANRLDPSAEMAIIGNYIIEKDLKSSPSTASFDLKPFDIITVFSSPGYVAQKSINLEGEVMFPGVYVISKNNERISDLIKRSGGLTSNSFAEGAMLIRTKRSSIAQEIISKNKVRALRKQSKDTSSSVDNLADEVSQTNEIVGIDLNKILKNPGSKYDLFLMENDVIRIPEKRQTVSVSGEVLYPVRIRYEKSRGFKSYVSGAGGFSSKSLKRASYIVYPNGTAKSTKHFLVFNFYPMVKPGSELVVPTREDKKPVSTLEITTIATSLATMVFLIYSAMSK